MPFATIDGPLGPITGEVMETLPFGKIRISRCDGVEFLGPPIATGGADLSDDANSDDQDHDMTPVMERRDD